MNIVFAFIAILSILQSVYSIYLMIYAWNDDDNITNSQPPTDYLPPNKTFSIILPAWKEKFYDQTLLAINKFDYPKDKFEVLLPLRTEDKDTIMLANRTIRKHNLTNFKLIFVSDETRNKPNQLNWALKEANNDIVTIFDSEDEPSTQLLNIVNTTYLTKDIDIVQCTVQLINYMDNWFSLLNAMEYYFWFKSTLNVFAKHKAVPLAGNTVFIKTEMVKALGGWDQTCLTEDGELGLRLATINAKCHIVYSSEHATLEETPPNTIEFIKQRTRWIQGFFQIFLKFGWLRLDGIAKKLLFLYILLWPIIQALLFAYLILTLILIQYFEVWLTVSMLATIPILVLVIQMGVLIFGVYNFCKEYNLKYFWWLPLYTIATFLPYQLIITYSSLRAAFREITKQNNWEKTTHTNAHRNQTYEPSKSKYQTSYPKTTIL
jgi:glycosyltransferase XagB